jgi:hypothetical protein
MRNEPAALLPNHEQPMSNANRILSLGTRRLVATPVFDTYWRFAAARQRLFTARVRGEAPPWTDDPILLEHRFTNAYRASDRVSQYLIRNVIYSGRRSPEEVVFRTLLFKLFNRTATWELLVEALGDVPTWRTFNRERYSCVLDAAMQRGVRLYSAAYIMPSPAFGSPRKHRNHLELLEVMMREGLPTRLGRTKSLEEVFDVLLAYPSLGDFLAFQFAIDLNYSEVIDFNEMDFVVAGPGAKSGIRKCFADTCGLSEREVIREVTAMADDEFDRLGLRFERLGGNRPLQLIDCQNLFCETDKYARVAHPEFTGASGRTRIKQRFTPHGNLPSEFYPPKWGLNRGSDAASVVEPRERVQLQFPFALAL